MKMTHLDLIEFIETRYPVSFDAYYMCDGFLVVNCWIEFILLDTKFTELPNDVIFNDYLDLDDSSIEIIPGSIVLNTQSVFMDRTKIKSIPFLDVSATLSIINTEIELENGMRFGKLWANNKYKYIDQLGGIYMNGNLFS